MKENYLLKSERAYGIYARYAKDLPIIDYHNHLSVEDVKNNRRYKNITELWLATDPYKHRLMRMSGVDEKYVTGNSSDFEKFEKFCEIFPMVIGTPVYDWSRMELSRVFGIEELPSKETAKYILEKTGELLSRDGYSFNEILGRFNVEYQSPVAELTADLSSFHEAKIAPSLRGDSLLVPNAALKEQLSAKTGISITDTDSYISAISVFIDEFAKAGTKIADHSLDDGFFAGGADSEAVKILVRLGVEYSKRGWTMLLHLGAKRKTSDRLRALAGAAGGYAAPGNSFDISSHCDMLGEMERSGGLPRTVMFPLNMSDAGTLAVMSGSFSEDGVGGKIQIGPPWWWCDHAFGIKNALDSISSFGLLSQFIGMTTDSRSILSFVRHDYFRRLLCNWLVEKDEREDLGLTDEVMGELIRKICYENAKLRVEENK